MMMEEYPASHFSGSYADLFTGVLGLNSMLKLLSFLLFE